MKTYTDHLKMIASKGKKVLNISRRAYLYTTKKHILIYTDSRGNNIPNEYGYKHYSTRLSNRFYVDAFLCPEKWTTIPDFLKLYKKLAAQNYDYVILHAGVVDASPRPRRSVQEIIYPEKKDILDELFGADKIQAYHNSDLNCDYEGDKTINLYSLEMARHSILPRLKQIPNLIWVSSNRIVPGWRGNYWKDRPANIAILDDYARLFVEELDRVVNLTAWSLKDVQRYTFDNIHPNQAGSDYIFARLIEYINPAPVVVA